MPIPDAELPPIVENGDGLFSDLESDLARELLAAREFIADVTRGANYLERVPWGQMIVKQARALLPEEPSDEQS